MQFHRLSSGRAQLITAALCTGLMLACSDDTDDTAKLDAAAEHDHEAAPKKPAESTSAKQSAAKQADAGHVDASAADSGKGEQNDNQPSPADSGKASEPPASDNKDNAAKKDPADKSPAKDSAAESRKVSVRFQAKLGKSDFACSHKIPSQGTANTTVTPRDFRLFVHSLELIKDDGSKVPVALNVRDPWQSESVALLDFEDKSGRCSDGTEGTNTAITGTVAPGSYKGIRFVVGVPEDLDHKDQAGTAEPLKSAAGLGPQGTTGFRFARLALGQLSADGSSMGSGLFELASTQCAAAAPGSAVKCDNANRGVIELAAFDSEKNSIVIDAAALFSSLDLSQSNDCHSTEKLCAPMFGALGVDFTTGQSKAEQTLFRVE